MKLTNSPNTSNLEQLLTRTNLTADQLYQLYTDSLLEDLETLKKKLNGQELKIGLQIYYLIQNKFPVNKILEIINTSLKERELKNLILKYENFFKSEDDLKNLIDFINRKYDTIFISAPLDKNFFTEFKRENEKILEQLRYILEQYIFFKNTHKILGISFHKIQVKTALNN